MRGLFNYDSKIMQILMVLADLFILNLIFLICCIPLFTIGAAQAGLFSGIRRLMDPEDDRSCVSAFFKGFANGFKKITLIHTLSMIVIFLVSASILAVGNLAMLEDFTSPIPVPPIWMCAAALALCALFHSMLAPFHATFDCTTKQLFRNTFLMIFAYPIRAIIITVLIWLPFGLLLGSIYLFMLLFPLWGILYYSVAYLFSFSILKKPFNQLKENFHNTQETTAQDTANTISEETEVTAE